MKKIVVAVQLIVSLLSGCSFDLQVLTPTPSMTAPPAMTQTTPMPAATIPPTAETPAPGFTPTTSDPVFFGAFVSLEPDGIPGQSRFATGADQLFAIWHYQNMRAGLRVRREWYLDGQLWLAREEPWDFVKYGERGIIRDISIYDFDVGLPAGVYQLVIFIDSVNQPIGKATEDGTDVFIEFEILPPIEATSPDGQWIARSLLDRLILTGADGTQVDSYMGREIAAVVWLPDNQHLLFVDRDRSKQVFGLAVGIHDDLWIVDISSRETRLIYASDTRIAGHDDLLVSPDGRFVASHEGSGFGDACFVDTRVIFFGIADDYKSAKAIKQADFAGMPILSEGVVFPTGTGRWEAEDRFAVPLSVSCATDESLSGAYVFDVPNLRVENRL